VWAQFEPSRVSLVACYQVDAQCEPQQQVYVDEEMVNVMDARWVQGYWTCHCLSFNPSAPFGSLTWSKRWQPPRCLQYLRQVDLEQFLLTRVLLQPTTMHTRRVGTGRWLLLVRW
jgi:hypothetical protein